MDAGAVFVPVRRIAAARYHVKKGKRASRDAVPIPGAAAVAPASLAMKKAGGRDHPSRRPSLKRRFNARS